MKNRKCLIVLGLILLTSCTPIAKLITGVRNAQIYMSNEERVPYYKPFYETHKTKIKIYTPTNKNNLQIAFDSLWVPRIYVENTKTDSVYVLDCYEDVESDVKAINNNKLASVPIANKKEYNFFRNFIETKSTLTYTENSSKEDNKWNVYMINGTFMGTKMRKRSLPVSTINSLREIVVLDTSINKESTENSKG